jgi:hypothetical protein
VKRILIWLPTLMTVMLCAACAGPGGASSDTGNGSSVTMYGTVDEGVSVRK